MNETRRKSREEIRREIREFIRLNNIADPDILAALAEELGYRMRRTRWTEGEMRRYKRSAGLGGFAEALFKLIEPRNETTLEELIAEELGYIIRVKTKSSESMFEAPIKRA